MWKKGQVIKSEKTRKWKRKSESEGTKTDKAIVQNFRKDNASAVDGGEAKSAWSPTRSAVMNVCPQRRGRSPQARYRLKAAHRSCRLPLKASVRKTWPGSPAWPVGMRAVRRTVPPVTQTDHSINLPPPYRTLWGLSRLFLQCTRPTCHRVQLEELFITPNCLTICSF